MDTKKLRKEKDNRHRFFYILYAKDQRKNRILVEDLITLGRDQSCNLCLNDEFVSWRHARVEKRKNSFILKDMMSRNGTFLNGNRIHEAEIQHLDRVKIGKTEFTFVEGGKGAEVNILKSQNRKWQEKLDQIPLISSKEATVLVTGPSGSGKELICRKIHDLSKRRQGSFVSVNCSALNDNLIESELFGHIKGAFTGAETHRKGAFESARGGTLFLDEIGDLPLNLQPKLLRALENREIRPLGSDRNIQVDVRLLAATHHNLKHKVMKGEFRKDLYYRLNVVEIKSPPLSERMEDFEELLFYFCRNHRVNFSRFALEHLKSHSWPGNIRELKNLVVRSSALFGEKRIQKEDLESLIDEVPESFFEKKEEDGGGFLSEKTPVIKSIEKELILERLLVNKGNQKKTAKDLGMPPSTLNDRLKKYSIDAKKIKKTPF